MDKTQILDHLVRLTAERIEECRTAIVSLRESRDGDSKSTAGDKHEVGRAMAQTEMDNLEKQLQRHLASKNDLDRLQVDRSVETIGPGSLVTIGQGGYFIAIGLGVVEIKGEKVFVISPSSPIGRLMMEKRVGDSFTFNGQKRVIETIA